jgi:adenosylcobinamide kinase/adenosylcobinamide-phosphate guanylyltransferase
VLLVDWLTLWASNLMLAKRDTAAASKDLVRALLRVPSPVVLVSNEVGLGIVPDNALARPFREVAGQIKQDMAAIARKVVMLFSGLPLTLKPSAVA